MWDKGRDVSVPRQLTFFLMAGSQIS